MNGQTAQIQPSRTTYSVQLCRQNTSHFAPNTRTHDQAISSPSHQNNTHGLLMNVGFIQRVQRLGDHGVGISTQMIPQPPLGVR
jgi:hypothetical protein